MSAWMRGCIILAACLLGSIGIPKGVEHAQAVFDPNVILEAKRATVGILRDSERFRFQGTGFHIGNGYVVTARHVVGTGKDEKAVLPRVTVLTHDLREMAAFLTGENAFTDVAVYRVEPRAALMLPGAVSFAASDPKAGEEVFTVGFPLDWGATVTYGRVGSEVTFLSTVASRLLQLDLSVCSGNSGGGLFNDKGEVVGIVHAVIQTEHVQGQGGCSRIAFAIPATMADRVLQDLVELREPKFAQLGITMEAVKYEDRWRVRVARAEGPAFEGGLREGDIILSVNQREIYTAAELKSFIIEEAQPNQTILVHVLRGSKELVMNILLGELGNG